MLMKIRKRKTDRKITKEVNPDKITISQFFKIQLKIIRELYNEYKSQTIWLIILSSILMCANFIDLKFLEYSTNSVVGYASGSKSDFKIISITFFIFMLAMLIMKVIQSVYDKIHEKYISKVVFTSEKKLINKLSSISYEYYESYEIHQVINLARQASGQYADAVFGITQIAQIILMLIVYGIILAKINALFVFIIIISITICILISTKVTDKQLDYWRSNVAPESRRNGYFKSLFSSRINHQNIQTNRTYPFFNKKYGLYNEKERTNYIKLNLFSFSSEMATSILFIATFFITAVHVASGVSSGIYEVGYFTMIIALLQSLFSTIKEFSYFMLNGNWYVKVLEAYYDVLNFSEYDERSKGFEDDKNGTDCLISLEHIKYKYPQSENIILKGISAKFKKGEKVAVIGHNGSGKTTLISIILSLLKSYEGEKKTGDIISTAIFQNFGHYQLTVKENIEIGCSGKKLSDDKVIEILKQVGLYDLISQKPDGIYTKLGQLDDGTDLSKGQWQRLAIARLLAKEESNVWILDEPTAYLDPLAEIELYNFIFDIAGDRLVFFISHRLGFAKNSDRIIVIDQGIIAEEGKHKELIEKGGLYADMFLAQKEWYK